MSKRQQRYDFAMLTVHVGVRCVDRPLTEAEIRKWTTSLLPDPGDRIGEIVGSANVEIAYADIDGFNYDEHNIVKAKTRNA